VSIIAPTGDAEAATHTGGACRFTMNEVGECRRCELAMIGVGTLRRVLINRGRSGKEGCCGGVMSSSDGTP
jgi:hypothetical protein